MLWFEFLKIFILELSVGIGFIIYRSKFRFFIYIRFISFKQRSRNFMSKNYRWVNLLFLIVLASWCFKPRFRCFQSSSSISFSFWWLILRICRMIFFRMFWRRWIYCLEDAFRVDVYLRLGCWYRFLCTWGSHLRRCLFLRSSWWGTAWDSSKIWKKINSKGEKWELWIVHQFCQGRHSISRPL